MSTVLLTKVRNSSAEDIIERLVRLYNVKSQSALQALLGLSNSFFTQAKKRNSIPFDLCILAHLEHGVSLEYLLFGEETAKITNNKSKICTKFKDVVAKGIQMDMLTTTEFTNEQSLDVLANSFYKSIFDDKV